MAKKKEKQGKNKKIKKKTTDRSKLKGVIKNCNKKYGGDYFFDVENNRDKVAIHRLSTGITTIDRIIGGGVPVGMITMLAGKEGAAKTYTCANIVRSAQETCKRCHTYIHSENGCKCGENEPYFTIYIDAENRINIPWFEKIGVDTSEELFLLGKPGHGISHAANVIVNCIDTGEVDLIVVDSIAQLAPKEELEASSEDYTSQGLAARKNNRFFRDLVSTLIRSEIENESIPTCVFINQYREDISIKYGNPNIMPGGKGQLYAASLILDMAPCGFSKEETQDDLASYRKKAKFRVWVKKSSVSPPKGKTEFTLYVEDHSFYSFTYEKGTTSEVDDLSYYAEKSAGILVKDKNKYEIKEVEGYDGMKFQTQNDFKQKLVDDRDFYHAVRKVTLDRVLK